MSNIEDGHIEGDEAPTVASTSSLHELSLFTEAVEATLCSVGVFMLADLRSLALPARNILTGESDITVTRNQTHNEAISFEDANEILQLPILGTKIRELNLKHKELLSKKKSGDFEDIIANYMTAKARPRSMKVYYMEDDNAHKECVYFIGRDYYRNVITLVFRGSITPRDWSEDVKGIIDHVPNPLCVAEKGDDTNQTEARRQEKGDENEQDDHSLGSNNNLQAQPDKVGIHWGFRNYLHGNTFTPLPMSVQDFMSSRKAPTTIGTSIGKKSFISSMFTANNVDNDDDQKEATENFDDDNDDNDNGTGTSIKDEEEEGDEGVEENDDDDEEESSKRKHSATKEERHQDEVPNEEQKTKIQLILEQLREMKRMYPNDPIFITGHSLGGALALISSLTVASDPTLNQPVTIEVPSSSSTTSKTVSIVPVTVVAVANPKVGNQAFNNAILELEQSQKLRCLCVHNEHDIVPMMTPPNFNKQPERDFCPYHPGFRLILSEDRFKVGRGTECSSNNNSDNEEDDNEPSATSDNGSGGDYVNDDSRDSSSEDDGNGNDSSGDKQEEKGDAAEVKSVKPKSIAIKSVWKTLQQQHSKWSQIVKGNVKRNRHDYRLYLERIQALEGTGLNKITLNSLYENSQLYDE